MDVQPPSGIIFHGPSGCGKTLMVECLASALGFNLVKVAASDVLDKYLGSSESAVRALFQRARAASPCLLFLDELDALAARRSFRDDANDGVHARVLATLLNEMDGVDARDPSLLVAAATNRLDRVDAALLRPGRFEERVFLGPPDRRDVADVFRRRVRFAVGEETAGDVCGALWERGATGAEVEAVCRDAGLRAVDRLTLRESGDGEKLALTEADFLAAMEGQLNLRSDARFDEAIAS